MADLLAKDFVLQAIDTSCQVNADKVIAKIRDDAGRGGIPWMVVLDGDGKRLVTSDGPKGNIGCPIQPHEISWFRSMLAKTRKSLSDADLDAVQQANEAFAEAVLHPPKKAEKKQ